MTQQTHEQTEDELYTALTLLGCISQCTDSEQFTQWYQSLNRTMQELMTCISLLQEQTALDNLPNLRSQNALRSQKSVEVIS